MTTKKKSVDKPYREQLNPRTVHLAKWCSSHWDMCGHGTVECLLPCRIRRNDDFRAQARKQAGRK